MRFLVGGYSPDRGHATGIGSLIAGSTHDTLAGGPLGFEGDAAPTGGSPSWLTHHPSLDVVYAALEADGAVRAWRRTGEASLTPLSGAVAAGETVCHVAVAPDGGSLIASCWGDGRVVRMTLDAAGRPSAPVTAEAAADPYAGDGPAPAAPDIDLASATRALREAAGEEYAHLVPGADPENGAAPEPEPDPEPDPSREGALLSREGALDSREGAFDSREGALDSGEGALVSREGALAASRVSRAHQAIFLPNGVIATTDMGFDLVRFWRVGASGLTPVQQVVLPLGSGPRHTVWHPSGHLYVLTELSHEVFVLAPDPSGAWRIVAGTPLGVGVLPDDTAAELCSSRDGEFLYAGLRGSNTIATLRVRGDGSEVTPVALVETGVDWPRHHVVIRDTLLVAGQRSDEVASLTLDLRTGVPGRVRHRTAVPTPTCLLPVR